jgi:two-component system, OmpR family, sensor kinase
MRLFWKLFAAFGIAMAVTIAATVYVAFRLADQAFDQLNFEGRERVIQEAAEALQAGGEWRLRIWLLRNPRPAPGMALLVLDENGNELLGRTPPSAVAKLLRTEPFRRSQRPPNVRPQQVTTEIIGPDGKEYRLVFGRAPVTFLGILTWPGTQVAVLTIALIASALTSLLLARYLSAPIVRLQKAARALAAGQLETRVGPPFSTRADEAGRLAKDFDKMAERLQSLVMDKETLLRDVSHEFRSPLARITVALALAQRRAGEAAQGDLERIERETERLNELVGQVMTLTRLRTETKPVRVPVMLADVVGEVIADARFEHPEADIRFTRESIPAVLGDPVGLKSAVENVVRNAVSHGGVDRPVEVTLEGSTKEVRLRVRDHGPGVPVENTQRIFEPFFRVDPSRDHGSGGQGIGLAITARVMELHGGTASARNCPDGGLEVQLVVPVTPPEPKSSD